MKAFRLRCGRKQQQLCQPFARCANPVQKEATLSQ